MDDTVDALLMSAKDGDRHALARLIADVRLGVLRYLVAQGHATHDAEDVAQDVCIAVLDVVPRWQHTGHSLWGFVFRTTRNRVVDNHRRSRRRVVSADGVETLAESLVEHRPGPEDVALQKDANRGLDAVLSTLPRNQRDVLILRAVVGLSTRETAEALALAEGSVHVLQHRAVSRLRTLLNPAPVATH